MKKCELCDSVARMYCESDQASLCFDCDIKVHGANFLVAKHSRTLLCHVCQSLTPWVGSGLKLGPTVSVCVNCVSSSNKESSRNEGNDEEDDDDDDGGDGDGDGDGDDGEANNEEEDDGGSDGGADDDDDDDDGDGDEDEENQVVPWSSDPPPPISSSSSCTSSDQECVNEKISKSRKRMRCNAYLYSQNDEGCCLPSQLERKNCKRTQMTILRNAEVLETDTKKKFKPRMIQSNKFKTLVSANLPRLIPVNEDLVD